MRSLLIIEDEISWQNLCKKLLKECERCMPWEVTVNVCGSMMEAAIEVPRLKPDCAVLDLTLRDSSRDQTILAMPHLKEEWGIPIVVLTGSMEEETRGKCFNYQADDFCTKEMALKFPSILLEKCYNAFLRFENAKARTAHI